MNEMISSNVIVLQVVCFMVLVGLFIYVFKKYPLKKEIRSIVYASLLVVCSVALNALSMTIPFFGVPSLKVGFTYIPLLVSGFILAPSYSYLVGLTMDVIGLMITPSDFPFLGFTMNHVLASTLPAIFVQKTGDLKVSFIKRIIQIIFALVSVIAIIYVFTLDEVSVSGEMFQVDFVLKISITTYIIVMCFVLLFALHLTQQKISAKNASVLAKWMFVVVLAEIIINMLLTPVWLDVMYGIPWFVSTFIRIVKACVMIPLNIFIGYQVISVLKRIVKKS